MAIEAFDMILHPEMDAEAAVRHYAIGILRQGYPAMRGTGLACTPEAIKKYGVDVFQKIENIYKDCLATGRSVTIHVTWPDGRPEIVVAKQGRIIIPGVN